MKLFIAICSATLLSFSISALAQSNQSYSKQYSKNPSAQVKAEKVFIFDPRTKNGRPIKMEKKWVADLQMAANPDIIRRVVRFIFTVKKAQIMFQVNILSTQMDHAAAQKCRTQCILQKRDMRFMALPLFQIKIQATAAFA